jgi:4a-hydroxytetrahydrobiopterin dehydratase
VPCNGGATPLEYKRIAELHHQIPEWQVVADRKVRREYKFPDFASGLEFVNKVGELAEEEGHHPDLLLAWGRVEVNLTTHSIDGLSENDFIMAAKIGKLQG